MSINNNNIVLLRRLAGVEVSRIFTILHGLSRVVTTYHGKKNYSGGARTALLRSCHRLVGRIIEVYLGKYHCKSSCHVSFTVLKLTNTLSKVQVQIYDSSLRDDVDVAKTSRLLLIVE